MSSAASNCRNAQRSLPGHPRISPPHPQRIHFLKEDERLLRKLLSKIKAQADTVRQKRERWGGGGGGEALHHRSTTNQSPPFPSSQVDVHEAAGAQASELSSLKAIVGKYGVSGDDMQKLLDWKHAH